MNRKIPNTSGWLGNGHVSPYTPRLQTVLHAKFHRANSQDLAYFERYDIPIYRWLQALQARNKAVYRETLTFAHNDKVKQLISEIHRLTEELTIADERTCDSERHFQSTMTTSSYLSDASINATNITPTQSSVVGKGKGLYSSLSIPEELKEFWYPVEFSSRLDAKTLIPMQLFGENWLIWRDSTGKPLCTKDHFPVEKKCSGPGWPFDPHEFHTLISSAPTVSGSHFSIFPTSEHNGLIWLWPGSSAPSKMPPLEVTRPPLASDVHAELVLEVPVEHGLLLENLLDLAHAPFTHTNTFAKGWPVPDAVKFHANKMLGGRWDPYPIEMSFEPPCMVVSTIGLAQPGKIERGARAEDCSRHLHQLHVCLPSGEGSSRLLYLMSLDFLGWSRHVPGIKNLWASVADQVLGEDLRLVIGQQERMKAGNNVWANPVSYDKLGVRYRRWRNAVSMPKEKARLEKQLKAKITAGQLFAFEE